MGLCGHGASSIESQPGTTIKPYGMSVNTGQCLFCYDLNCYLSVKASVSQSVSTADNERSVKLGQGHIMMFVWSPSGEAL